MSRHIDEPRAHAPRSGATTPHWTHERQADVREGRGGGTRLQEGSKAVPFDHTLDRFPIDGGFPGDTAHVSIEALEEIEQIGTLEGSDDVLFGIPE